jgi:hypothetical protein
VIGQMGFGDGDVPGAGETVLVDPIQQDEDEEDEEEPVHTHVGMEKIEDEVRGGGGHVVSEVGDTGLGGGSGAEAPMVGTMEMGVFKT